jgi:hypothetical protein
LEEDRSISTRIETKSDRERHTSLQS